MEKSLIGPDDGSLKERIIGVEVFGRNPDYDTAYDAIVRARVGEVRKRLAQHYQSPEGQRATVQISIPHGAYRVQFTFRAEKDDNESEPPVTVQTQAESPHNLEEFSELKAVEPVFSLRKSGRWRPWSIASVAVCAAVLLAWALPRTFKKSELDLFWSPFYVSKKPPIIYMGTAQLYVPAEAATERSLSQESPDDLKKPLVEWTSPALTPGKTLTSDDLLINSKDFVAVGDIETVVHVARLLTANHQNFLLRSGSNLPFEDLRGTPAILTGGGSNYWAMDMTQSLPFFVDRALRIRERGGQNRVWSSKLWSDHSISEDYAIVYRLLDSRTDAPLLAMAGITMCGTRAAGEFLTDSVQMRKLGSIPRDALEHKNLEFVLHANLVNCNPTSIDIVDMRYW